MRAGVLGEAATTKPPSGTQDLGSLSAANDYYVLLNLTLKNGSLVVHTVDVDEIPASRSRLLVAVKTYWNKYPNFAVVDASATRQASTASLTTPQSIQHLLAQHAGTAWREQHAPFNKKQTSEGILQAREIGNDLAEVKVKSRIT